MENNKLYYAMVITHLYYHWSSIVACHYWIGISLGVLEIIPPPHGPFSFLLMQHHLCSVTWLPEYLSGWLNICLIFLLTFVSKTSVVLGCFCPVANSRIVDSLRMLEIGLWRQIKNIDYSHWMPNGILFPPYYD